MVGGEHSDDGNFPAVVFNYECFVTLRRAFLPPTLERIHRETMEIFIRALLR